MSDDKKKQQIIKKAKSYYSNMDDPSATTSIGSDQLHAIFDMERSLEEGTDPEYTEELQRQIRSLSSELEHAKSEISLHQDLIEDMSRKFEFSSLSEMRLRVELDKTHRIYRSVMHHLEIAITICYDASSAKLWMSRRALELLDARSGEGASMDRPEDWSTFGRFYDEEGNELGPRDLPLWQAIVTGKPQLGKIVFINGRWVHIDAYFVDHRSGKQGYAIWFEIDPQMPPPPNAIRDLLP